jgi:hypothetical protein
MSIFKKDEVKALNDTVKANAEARGNYDKRDVIPFGAHRMVIASIEAKNNVGKDKDKHQLLIELKKFPETDQFRPVLSFFTLDKEPGSNFSDKALQVNKEILVEMFQKAFGYEMGPAETVNDLKTQLSRFVNKPFKVAVRHRKELFRDEKGNTHLINRPEPWYYGSDNDATFSMKSSAGIIPLKPEDQRTWDNIQHQNSDLGGGPLPGENKHGNDPLPWEEVPAP